MGQSDKKSAKPAKMRTLRVSVAGAKKKAPAKATKVMNFTEWVENYVKMSKGNPV